MTRSPEIYTPGYAEPTLRLMLQRTAAKHAAFFTPYLRGGMCVLDCGCGPATITLDLAKLVSPGQVVGIDLEPNQLRSAQDRSRQQGINASFGVASVYNLRFADSQFDAVFAHALFEHLREPARALSEMRRVLRSSGIVALRSPDWAGWLVYPPCPLIEQGFDSFKKIQIANGGNPHVGRALSGLLRQSGFSNVSFSASYELVYDPAFFIDRLASCLELKGNTELRQNAEVVRDWSEHPDAIVAVSWFEGIATA
ncbi:MAG TPA: methyltransferase domain-containing protein [Terriglobales bacterium]|nr:methyltransferase domain-containing protein [Terriglobales bacterium]